MKQINIVKFKIDIKTLSYTRMTLLRLLLNDGNILKSRVIQNLQQKNALTRGYVSITQLWRIQGEILIVKTSNLVFTFC